MEVSPWECRVLDTGYCIAHEHHMIQGGRRVRIHCHSIVAFLRHPKHGNVLWDTGYAPRMLEETRTFPGRLYRWITPLRLDPTLAAVTQLENVGVAADEIHLIVLSHFHADHVAGLKDFPRARIIASQSAYDDVRHRRGWNALRRAFLPGLMPADFASRANLLPTFAGPEISHLGPCLDLFGDHSLRLVALPGHARGQIGMYVETTRGPLLFAADGAWLSQAIRENRPPHWITHHFIDDVAAMRDTLTRLHHFAKEHPEVTIVPTHCPETFRLFTGKEP